MNKHCASAGATPSSRCIAPTTAFSPRGRGSHKHQAKGFTLIEVLVAISVMALGSVDDLARVFRQVHRVLKPEAPLVCSVTHPAFAMIDPRHIEQEGHAMGIDGANVFLGEAGRLKILQAVQSPPLFIKAGE